ncbi:hypothetical protein [Chitinophaga sancti]|uniref:Uncharacterized protein n=1 Tax=Chitinophaga sancti TaxID=1004 RepID=A0A1K1LPY1_9BACT|nr:hypothetical protein [Chitinophaga sancti]WQD64942.1 hypothetical protein U0033_11105 [Chitinophaga sancti]WQG89434.1 hypothetical protein SR876_31365 [Chitinophaga sancti]SFW12936.1 hypothetical protein SAMN05661012_00119 [Chitinophaga sancti]
MSKIFDIDYHRLIRLLMPPRLRKVLHLSWLQAITYPVNLLYQQFRRNRDANLYRLSITPQVVYMEKLLNDRYDLADRGIRIVDAVSNEVTLIYQEEESKPKFLYLESEEHPLYLFTEAEIGNEPVDFYVLVPKAVSFNDDEMAALIDTYKLAGMAYKIQRV